MTRVLQCNCSNAFQDATYGYKNRVHNAMVKGRSIIGWRCTVCGVKKDSGKETIEKKEK